MPIYTGGGDDGTTSLFGGERVGKHALRVELMGSIDELSAALGMAVAYLATSQTELTGLLQRIQSELFVMGADVATPQEPRAYTIARIMPAHANALEEAIDAADTQLAPLTDFVLPGGTPAAAALHFARAVCRRTERIAVALAQEEELSKPILVYLNRLSDLLFTLGRLANHQAGTKDVRSKDALPPE
ncbi:MAG: cob(I)yrinic acid a,c-diamide adenosyltransferase [Chloroflexota bacterium]|nr:cob(I)yrinic acid a,c-diamide adenosyltransferase [Chloroflexota bacterium]